ncbi:MAG: hypothetical protein IT531_11870 [Burkholderiales bacterium]|nr:hypothetical protein [Burkholderiales bacterium]
MTGWLRAHARALGAALGRIFRHPAASLLEAIVLGMALALPLGLYVAIDGVHAFASRHASAPELSVYLALGADQRAIDAVRARLEGLDGVDRVDFISRQDAAKALRKSAGLAEALDALPDNPLPDAFAIHGGGWGASRLERLRSEIALWPQVALVQVDAGWARTLEAAAKLGRAVAALLGVMFGLAALAIVFNTVRLQLLDRRDEIELSRLIGATPGFICRPFVYLGALQGLLGGAVALLLVLAASAWLNAALVDFSIAYGAHLSFRAVPWGVAGAILAGAGLLGATAARLAAGRQLWA